MTADPDIPSPGSPPDGAPAAGDPAADVPGGAFAPGPGQAPEVPALFFSAGEENLRWIGRFLLVLWPLGAAAWLFRSPWAALVFACGGAVSLVFWHAHLFLVGRMLSPSVPRRWIYAVLGLGKLALIVVALRAIMGRFPKEAVPLATGLLLFVAAILLEALRLAFRPEPSRE